MIFYAELMEKKTGKFRSGDMTATSWMNMDKSSVLSVTQLVSVGS